MLYKEVVISGHKFLIAELDELLFQETLIPTLPIIPGSQYDSDLTTAYSNDPDDKFSKYRHVINGTHFWGYAPSGNRHTGIYRDLRIPAGLDIDIVTGKLTGKCGGYMYKGHMLTSLNMYGQYGDIHNKTIGRCSMLAKGIEGVCKISPDELTRNPNTKYMYRPVLIYLGPTNEPANIRLGIHK